MSREPSSPMMSGWDTYKEPKPKRPPRVRVEPKKKPRPARALENMVRMNEAAFTKLMTTTEALTAEERGLLRELREVHPDAAGQALSRIQEAKRQKEGR